MRFASSKAAVASSSSSSRAGSGGGGGYGYGGHGYGYVSPVHVRRDGAPDMRYAENRTAAAAAPSPSSVYGYAPATPPPAAVHMRRDGITPDMRYAENRAAAAAPTPPPAAAHLRKDGLPDLRYRASDAGTPPRATAASPGGGARADGVKLTKAGVPDMRYKNARAVASTAVAAASMPADVKLTKSGVPDMRYKNGREWVAVQRAAQQSSAAATASASSSSATTLLFSDGAPLKLTRTGLPDMRDARSKAWVEAQAAAWTGGELPDWLPRRKDGLVQQTACAAAFLKAAGADGGGGAPAAATAPRMRDFGAAAGGGPAAAAGAEWEPASGGELPDPQAARSDMYADLASDPAFQELLELLRAQAAPSFPVGDDACVADVPARPAGMEGVEIDGAPEWAAGISEAAPRLPDGFARGVDAENNELGRGVFGVVKSGTTPDGVKVAVKFLNVPGGKIASARDAKMFKTELAALVKLGGHPNILRLVGYELNPACIATELAPRGSLMDLMSEGAATDEDAASDAGPGAATPTTAATAAAAAEHGEAVLALGKYKKMIALGIANGLFQVAEAGMVHCDVKPENGARARAIRRCGLASATCSHAPCCVPAAAPAVLIMGDYTPKIGDFGLMHFRGVSSSVVASKAAAGPDANEGTAGGTYAYQAPESVIKPDGTMSDTGPSERTMVYSFGILLVRAWWRSLARWCSCCVWHRR